MTEHFSNEPVLERQWPYALAYFVPPKNPLRRLHRARVCRPNISPADLVGITFCEPPQGSHRPLPAQRPDWYR